MVWISDFDYRMFYYVRLKHVAPAERKISIEVFRDLTEGRWLADPALAPVDFRLGTDRKSIPDICMVQNGLVVVNERLHDLLRGFDLGATQFIEVSVTTRKGAPFPGRFFIMNVAEWKEALVPERSNVEACDVIRRGPIFRTWGIADPRMTVTLAALEGADIWRDRLLRSGVFVSDRLADACRAAKIRPIRFYPVEVAEGEPVSAGGGGIGR